MAPMTLRNSYWILRHGRSKANEAGIIVSDIKNGIKEQYALADKGKEQAREAGKKLAAELASDSSPLVIYFSPFSRTRETATLAGEAVGIKPEDDNFVEALELRERYFGSRLEMQADSNYEESWELDQRDATGESAQMVSDRLRAFLTEVDSRHEGTNILLVSHGDVCQILQATVRGTELGQHRRDYAIETGQLVRVV